MNTPLSWIKAYVPGLNVTAQEYTDAMTLSGSKVEGYVALDKNLDKIVVGQILNIEKHPNADKLVSAKLMWASEAPIQICTGAPNVFEGAFVPVVLVAAKWPGSRRRTSRKKALKLKRANYEAWKLRYDVLH